MKRPAFAEDATRPNVLARKGLTPGEKARNSRCVHPLVTLPEAALALIFSTPGCTRCPGALADGRRRILETAFQVGIELRAREQNRDRCQIRAGGDGEGCVPTGRLSRFRPLSNSGRRRRAGGGLAGRRDRDVDRTGDRGRAEAVHRRRARARPSHSEGRSRRSPTESELRSSSAPIAPEHELGRAPVVRQWRPQ